MPRRIIPVEVPDDHRYCFGCEAVRPLSAFAVYGGKPAHRCRSCLAAKARERAEIARSVKLWAADRKAWEEAYCYLQIADKSALQQPLGEPEPPQ